MADLGVAETADGAAPMLSSSPGEGTGSMATLIQKAMTNILTPLAQRVIELEDRSATHTQEIKDLQEKLETANNRLAHHDCGISGLHAELARTKEDLRATSEQVVEAHEKHSSLENDHDVTRSLANRLESNHKSLGTVVSDQQRSHEDLDGRCRQLQLAMSETNISHININDRLTELRNRLEGLNDRHLDLVKTSQETKQSDENTRAALKRLSTTCDKQRKDCERSFGQLDDRSKNLEAGMIEMQHNVEKSAKASKTARSDIAQLRSIMDQLVGDSQGKTQQGQAEPSSKPNDVQGRVNKVEELINKLSKTINTEKAQQMTNLQSLIEAIQKNSSDVSKSLNDIEGLDKTVKVQDHRILKVEQKGTDLSVRQERLKEQLDKSEVDLRGVVTGVQRDLTTKMDTQSHELSKTNANLQLVSSRLDGVQAQTQHLHTELGNTNGTVDKMGQSLDLAHEYFQGVTKGFHDTHKRVLTGQDGMLPPKGGGSKMSPPKTLPVIPTSPARY